MNYKVQITNYRFTYFILLILLLNCTRSIKDYTPLHYHKPIHAPEQKVNTNSAPYVKVKNGNEYIEYIKKYPDIKYYSNIDKKTNTIILNPDQCIYDGFIIEGEDWFQDDIIKALNLLEKKCNEEYNTIKNGIIDEKDNYHKGVRMIRQSEGYPTLSRKETDKILLGKQDLSKRKDKDYYKMLAASIAGEGYRLIYWDEWGPLPEWWDEKEGIKLQHRVLKKLNASYYQLRQLEKVLDEQDEEIFYQRLHEE